MDTVLKIEGMSCQHCVMRVKKALEALEGVAEVTADVGSAKVTYDESRVKKSDLEEAVLKSGYKIAA